MPRTLWVYRSTLMPATWRAWACLGTSKQDLRDRCFSKYGRVPVDCVAIEVEAELVPLEHLQAFIKERHG